MNKSEAHKGLAGKWRGILTAFGLDELTLSGKNTKCPLCGGKDRFHFDDKDVGMYYCQQCGPGDGFKLLAGFMRIDFKEAKAKALEHAGIIEADKPFVERTIEDKRKALASVWNVAKRHSEDLIIYMRNRGIEFTSDPSLRWHANLPWRCTDDDGTLRKGTNPAMVARYYQWENGKAVPVTIHRIWPSGCPKKKMVMPPTQKMSGIFCPLGGNPVDGHLGVVEGIETGLSYTQLIRDNTGLQVPVWSLYSAEQMIRFQPPIGVKDLHIGMDVDYSFTGQAAAYELARRMRVQRPEIAVHIGRPTPLDGTDWDFNDELKSRKSKG